MTSERWQHIQEVFYRADELRDDARAAYLDTACDGDLELRREVEELLATADKDPGLVQQCVGAAAGEVLACDLPSRHQTIGPWEVLRTLGAGGMGVVYLARRADDAYQQQVALKVIGPAFAGTGAVARFRRERQILANLSHPNIARLLDGGLTDAGQPYLVMEYIDGEPIDSWCKSPSVTLRDRLELFRDVCAAVHAAHQNLIVHRDIKPANILICRDGTPRLLDFGVAKILESESDLGAPRTRLTEQLMTPEYSSPEQLLGEPTTTATDVYALGVLLYEMVTGKRPFQMVTRTPGELERLICESEAPRPSTVARTGAMKGTAAALRGDLDNIVLKAMHKVPARRYASAAELSDDIRRYLQGFPVLARPDSLAYRVGKFVRRHKVAVASAAALVVVLVGFSVGMAVLARRAQVQRHKAEQVSTFLVNLFSAADPDRPQRGDFTAREMLDRGVKTVESLQDPEARTSLMDTFGLVYENLGAWERSRDLLRSSLELKRRLYAADSLEIASNLKNLAELERRQFNLGEAEKLIRESVDIRRARLGEHHVLTAESTNTLALVMHQTGRLREAERLFLQVLSDRASLRERNHLETAVLSNLGALYGDLDNLQSAEKYLNECVAIRRRELGSNHPRLALAVAKLGQILEADGKLVEAEAALRESLAIRQNVLGDRHPDVVRTMVSLAGVSRKRRAYNEARSLLAQAGELQRQLPDDKEGWSSIRHEQGLLADAMGDFRAAERALRESLNERLSRLGHGSMAVARARVDLAKTTARMGRTDESKQLLQDALGVLSERLPAQHSEVLRAKADLAGLQRR